MEELGHAGSGASQHTISIVFSLELSTSAVHGEVELRVPISPQ